MELEEIVQLQKHIPFLSDLTVEELQDLLRVARIRIYREGQFLFREGMPADGMYIVLRGEAKVEKRLEQGDQLVLSKLKTGDVVGEMGLVEQRPRSASVKAVTRCSMFYLDAAVFDELRRQRHPAAMKILKQFCGVLAKRARRLDGILTDFFENPERSLDFMEKRYLKFVGHPAQEQ